MAAPRYLALLAGVMKQVVAITSSAGAADAEKIVATAAGTGILADSIMGAAETGNSVVVKTKSDGTLDSSILPAGLGADTASIQASEALSAGDIVNIHNSSGARVRKADATTEGKEAHGFVLAAVSSGAMATVYFEGKNTSLATRTPGATQYLSTTPGGVTETAPGATGNVVQSLGEAYSASAMNFEKQPPIVLA